MPNIPRKKNLSIAEKVVLLRRIEAGEKNTDIAREYGLVHSAVSYMIKKKEQIYKNHRILLENQGDKSITKLSGVEESPIEKSVYQWYKQQRKLGIPITGTMIREKALEFSVALGGPSNFRASDGWLTRFKKRHGIRRSQKMGNKLTNDDDEEQLSPDQFNNYLKHNMFDLDNVYNMSETAIVWRSLPFNNSESTNDFDNKMIALICTNATGTHKLPLMVIGNEENPSCFKNVVRMPVIYHYSKHALFDKSVFIEWFKTVFVPNIIAKNKKLTDKYLLLLQNTVDCCYPSAQQITEIDSKFDTFFLSINPWESNQPTEQGIIQTLKLDYRKNFLMDIMMQEAETLEQLTNYANEWTILDFCRSLAASWEAIDELCIVNAWKKVLTGISYFDDDNECLTDIAVLLQRLPECETISIEDITYWLNRDNVLPIWNQVKEELLEESSSDITADEILQVIKTEKYEDNMEEESCIPTAQEAFAAIKTLYEWCETHLEYKQEDLYNLRRIHQAALNIVLKGVHEDLSE